MRRTVFVIFGIFVLLMMVVWLVGCTGIINHLLGDRIVELNVKNSHGAYTSIYLKSNSDIITISESSDMNYIGLQENSAIIHDPIIVYKNTADSLYIVWWSENKLETPQIKTDANIKFIYEPHISPELVQSYLSLGYTKFPEDSYR